jgi:hypothetical protein
MNRSEFIRTSCRLLGVSATAGLLSRVPSARAFEAPADTADTAKQLADEKNENDFTNHWLTDLFETIDHEVDGPTKIKLLEGCGRGCYRRHSFKQDIAREGQGSVEKLITAYRKYFEAWREGDLVHIRYGEVSPGCYCPAAKHRPALPNDLHCECTRMSHQTIFETALGRPVKLEIVESVRRGGKTCHLVAHV